MGVFRLFRHLSKRYPNCINNFKDPNKYAKRGEPRISVNHEYETDACLVDCNAFIHPVCQKVFEYNLGDDEKKNLFWVNKKKSMTMEELEKMAFNMFCNKLENIIQLTKPKKYVYLAVDGVPGQSKNFQQRQRRFKSAQTSLVSPYGFDPNCITVGTEFMDRLCKHVFFFIRKKKQYEWKHLTIMFSDVSCPGEGEHKMIRWIETVKDIKSATICSPDADLIMLAMTLKLSQMYIFRENVFRDTDADYFFVDVKELKSDILKDIKYASLTHDFIESNALRDYVLFTFLLGNDFLPHTNIEIPNEGVDILYNCYLTSVIEKGNLLYEKNNKLHFNKESVTEIMKQLSSLEVKMILNKYENIKVMFPDKIVQNNIRILPRGKELNFEGYRKEYYMTKFKVDEENFESEVTNICSQYMKTMIYIANYYFKNIPTFSWMYNWCYSPLLFDLYKYCERSKLEYTFEVHKPLSKFESLLGILPLKCFYLLPSSVKESLEDKLYLDSDFNCEVEVDNEGVMQLYEAKLILPCVRYDKIQALFKTVKLTPEERKRNEIGVVYKF
jgi:5'-3' exonuclease